MTKKASYGRMKETTIGGFVMPIKYEKVQGLLPIVKELVNEGLTQVVIAKKSGFESQKAVDILLYREKHKKIAGVPKIRGRKPAKTLQEYKYENKRLKMENELLRDFLSLTERK